MRERIIRLIKIAVWTALVAFGLLTILLKPKDVKDYLDFAGYTVSMGTLLALAYEKWIWRFCLLHRFGFETVPVLAKHYSGTVRYTYNGDIVEKNMDIIIKQSLSTIQINVTTNTTISQTICSSLIREYGFYVLYYTFVTNPDVTGHDRNPMHYGTCRMLIRDNDVTHLKGSYWNTHRIYGDIFWDATA